MYFDSLSAVLTMDGHGAYVWSAYALTLLVVIYLVISPGRRQRRMLRELRGEIRRKQQHATPRGTESS
jgi:heme exporter protein D